MLTLTLTLTLALTLTLTRCYVPWPASSVAPRGKVGSIDSEGSTRPSEGSSASDAPGYSGGASAAGSDQGQYTDPPDQGAPSAEGVSSAAPPELRRLDTLTPTDAELPVQLASNGARPCMRSVLALFTAECYPPG